MKSMNGNERISPSRTMAKLCANGAPSMPLRARELRLLPALSELAGDVVELVAALVREVEEDDRLAGLRSKSWRVPSSVEIVARQLRDRVLGVVRLVLVEVVAGLGGADAAGHGWAAASGSSALAALPQVRIDLLLGTT